MQSDNKLQYGTGSRMDKATSDIKTDVHKQYFVDTRRAWSIEKFNVILW